MKKYTVNYRERRNKNAESYSLIIEGLNADDVKRKFWDKHQKYDIYARPLFTITNIKWDRNN